MLFRFIKGSVIAVIALFILLLIIGSIGGKPPLALKPDLPGGEPQEVRHITQFVQLYVVSDENLRHPEALKHYFEWRCKEFYQDRICIISFWTQANMVPMQGDLEAMSDNQLKARAGVYNLNVNTGNNVLGLEKNGEKIATY